MKRAKEAIDWVVGGALAFLMGVAVLNVLWQVFTRFVLGAPSSFTEELARYLLIWIGVLGAGYAMGQGAHLALELLPDRLVGRRRRWLELVILACVGAFAFFVMVGGGGGLVYVQFRLGQTSPSLGWPLGGVYLVLPLSGLLMTFYVAERMLAGRVPDERASDENTSAASNPAPVGEGRAPETTGPTRQGENPSSLAQGRPEDQGRSANQSNQPTADS